MPEAIRANGSLVNALTIDVEDYFQVSALAPHIPRADWEHIPCRIERNIENILRLLDEHQAKGTFFTLGWIAERYPEMVRCIVQEGHELASHGYEHERATNQTRQVFLSDIKLAKAVLEDIAGTEVRGYRAPSFSIGPLNPWAAECIGAAGYLYSSSIYPIHHDHYGVPDAPRFAHTGPEGVIEVPVSTVRLFSRNWPAGGGGYFRLLPYCVSRWFLRRVNEVDGQAVMFYFHPWELDENQPRVSGISAKTRFRHYLNLRHTRARLARLLKDFQWGRADHIFLGRDG